MDEAALRRIELFSSLSRKQRRLLAMRGDEVDVPAGKVLCCKGKTAHEFFVIEEGTARVVSDGQYLDELGPGDFFGEMGLLEGSAPQRRRDRGDAAQADRPQRPRAEGPRAREPARWPAGSVRRSSSAGRGFSRCPERPFRTTPARPRRRPARSLASTSPPCASAAWRTIARPRPEPGSDARVVGPVEAVEDVRQVGLLEARAVVAHAQPAAREVDLDAAVARAPLERVVHQVRDRALDPLGRAAHDGRLGGHVDRDSVRPRRAPAWATLSTISSSRTSSSASPGFAPRASSTMSATSAVSSSSSATMSARSDSSSARRQPLRVLERLDVRAQARDRRAQLVARVRHELALRLDRALERVERGVEAARQPAELVASPVTSIRCEGSGSPAISSVRRVKRSIGASAVRATTAASAAPSATPAAPTSRSTSSTRSSWRSTSSSGRATWIAPRLAERAGQDAHVGARRRSRPSGTRPSRCARSRASARPPEARRAMPGGRTTRPEGSTSCAKPSGPPKGSGGRAGNAPSGPGAPPSVRLAGRTPRRRHRRRAS